ncbi:MAG: T9SS type A sorting domain-containing protein [Bacteroidetes bacterium]|nr:T9SS type A sorting domain-containing protein [Bacteroidota bacterium]MBU1580835.1 T9SS type A sorting domain-containing protein [Bacteroidota bacterium]MBU2558385.1 T9SS type A sorting domain-containing protein [Bacteroidota bacterium]
MKQFTIFFLAMFLTAGIATAQMIEDFEHIPLNLMLGGDDDNSTMSIVPTPEGTTNPSTHVVKYERSMNGVPWGGFWSALPEQLDLTENKYVHVRVMKTRISPIKFKVEGGPGPNTEVFSMNEQTVVDEWEDIVFDFSEVTGLWNVIAFMPDFEDPLTLTEDIVIYFDYIMVNNDPTPGSDAVYVIEDFDHIPLNLMLGGDEDNSSMTVIANPDPDDVNPSANVIQYYRSMNGVPWGGFWSALPEPADLTENKYMYVKVWKPRVSPLKFKVEGGPSGNLEVPSMNPQNVTSGWEEIVFDFSEKTGLWNVIAFMPDFEDPLTLTEDIVLYFDDIRLMHDPLTNTAEIGTQQTLQVYPNPATEMVNIKLDEPIRRVEIYDLAGKMVYSQNTGNTEVVVELSSLKQGMYLMQIITDNKNYSHKLIH